MPIPTDPVRRSLPIVDESEKLPILYSGWLESLLGGAIPRERRATCDSCAMLGPDTVEHPGGVFTFNSETKCCTYQPTLPNFLVGAILDDLSPGMEFGRRTLSERMLDSSVTTPLGVSDTPYFRHTYKTLGGQLFGTSRELRCPHYNEDKNGLCGIWAYRNSVCTTWFCKHVRGATASKFWMMVRDVLGGIERQGAYWCALSMGIDPTALEQVLALEEEDLPVQVGRTTTRPQDTVRESILWGEWKDRKGEYFRECARRMSALTAENVIHLCGSHTLARLHVLRHLYADLIAPSGVPDHLEFAPFVMHAGDTAMVRVSGYSYNDPLDMTRRVLDVLHYFDGRPTLDAIEAIAVNHGMMIEVDLLRRLIDYKILRSPEDRHRVMYKGPGGQI